MSDTCVLYLVSENLWALLYFKKSVKSKELRVREKVCLHFWLDVISAVSVNRKNTCRWNLVVLVSQLLGAILYSKAIYMHNTVKRFAAFLECLRCFGKAHRCSAENQNHRDRVREWKRDVIKSGHQRIILAETQCSNHLHRSYISHASEGVPVCLSVCVKTWVMGEVLGGTCSVAVSHEIKMLRLENKPSPASKTLTHTYGVTLWTGACFITSSSCYRQ